MAVGVEAGEGVVTVAAGQQQKSVGAAAAHLLHVQGVARLHHDTGAPAGHLLGQGQVEVAVAGNQLLHVVGPGGAGAAQGENRLALRHGTDLRPYVGVDGEGVAAGGPPGVAAAGSGVQNDVKALALGGGDQIIQHVHAHGAQAEVAVGAHHDGGQFFRRGGDGLGAVIAQRLRLRHGAGAVHFSELFQDMGRDFIQLRAQAQGDGGLFGADGFLQRFDGHNGLLWQIKQSIFIR